ncbi:MAG: flagellar basal body P-ring protein FlgI, partial [Planctomycetota bacterium]
AVALVTGLDGTGEDPAQSPQRAAVLDEMKRRRVERPGEVLASPGTAIVLLRGFLPPGCRKGEKFDVEVRVPSRSETTSLRGGWVLPARLTEMAVLGNQIRSGHHLATAEGPILIDPSANPDEDGAVATRGRILGGGVARNARPLRLVIAGDHQSTRTSIRLAKSINDRFQTYEGGRKEGVAEAKRPDHLTLRPHPRYRDNLVRYMRVVRSIAVGETPTDRQERLTLLETQLLDPLTASKAALRLEAIGGELAIDKLLKGLESSDAEVRFYSAEALAYLDQTEGVAALAEAARDERAFRAHALAALSAMDDVMAYDSLREMLTAESAETRYGAFRALWAMDADDPLIAGDQLGGAFWYHRVDVDGPPMIHATRSGRPELVLFGADQRFRAPMVLDAGPDILVNCISGDEVTVSRFRPGEPTVKRTVTTKVDDVVRAIVELGGDYPDVVQALQQAKRDSALVSRFRVNAIPRAGRTYERDANDPFNDASAGDDGSLADGEDDDGRAMDSPYRVATPLPDLFASPR